MMLRLLVSASFVLGCVWGGVALGALPELNAVDRAILKQFDHLQDHSRIASKCAACHQSQVKEVGMSVHGKAGLLKSFPEGTLCLTCHEVNHIVRDPVKSANFQLDQFTKIPEDIPCMRCHGDVTITSAYKLAQHVPSRFEESLHYRKAMLGDRQAPLCSACHTNHAVLRTEDPSSPVHISHRDKLCAKCHPGANANFASVFDHTPITMAQKPLEYIVIALFKALTLGTFMALGLFILLDVISTIRASVWSRGRHPVKKSTQYIIRLPDHIRLQHFLMLGSVITLCLTAWPLLAPDAPITKSLVGIVGGVRVVAIIHRIAGFVMIGDFIYHVVYLGILFKRGGRVHPMVPVPKDLIDLWHMIQFFFGLRETRPEFNQFAFHEKFDYWAVFWGVAMMGGSGVVLTFPVWTAKVLPGWAISISNIVHADEALLAGIVLFIWHFYNVHLKPGIFPMNWAWITGRMRKDIYEHEHGGHVKQLKREGKW